MSVRNMEEFSGWRKPFKVNQMSEVVSTTPRLVISQVGGFNRILEIPLVVLSKAQVKPTLL